MRSRVLSLILYGGLMFLAAGLFQVQIVKGRHYRDLGEKNRIRLIPMEAPRGRVFDRQGRLLVTNRSSYDVVASPEDVIPEEIPLLARILQISEKEVAARLKGPREFRFAPSVIAEDISKEIVFKIEERKSELPGVSVRVTSLRYYPYHETASHLIGYIGKINEEEYRKLEHGRYGMNSYIGRAGIEKIYDSELRGWRGGRQVEVNARGDMIQVLSERYPEPGKDLTVTVDLEFQKRMMEAIKDYRASVAVMDLKTEEIIVLASSPAFDPNIFIQPGKGKERMRYLRDSSSPLLDRGVGSAYPPGSVFKLVTAIAGLETGKISPSTRFFCNSVFRLNANSRPFHCWYPQGHQTLNLYEALERSCNVYFYNVGSRLKPEDIARYSRELGLGERLKLEVTHITPGLVPDSAWKQKKMKAKWYQGETLTFAIGQGYLLTSPIQILRLVSIIAKDGEKVEPTIIREDKPSKDHDRVSIHPESIKVIKRGMLHVVESPYGTGQLARVDFTRMAAKTGTAQAPPKKAHAWMTGFFPYEKPEISFVVFVEHGGSGGITAAKVVKEMLKTWRELSAHPVA